MKMWIEKSILGASLVLAPLFFPDTAVAADLATNQPVSQQNANAQLYYQMQSMQEELMQVRGLLEEQQQQIQELKRQRLDDYKNIDKRLSEFQQTAVTAPAANASVEPVEAPVAQAPVTAVGSSSGGVQPDVIVYQQAYDIIKTRKFDQARDAFLAFNKKYPNSAYVGNSHYWLGELYIIEGNYVKAKASFQTIIKQYPSHVKYPEALYKIATVNYELGDRTTAKLQLDQLISQFGDKPINVVKKAREFLRANYP